MLESERNYEVVNIVVVSRILPKNNIKNNSPNLKMYILSFLLLHIKSKHFLNFIN